MELRLDTSRELLNSPSKLSADSKDEKNGKEEDLAIISGVLVNINSI